MYNDINLKPCKAACYSDILYESSRNSWLCHIDIIHTYIILRLIVKQSVIATIVLCVRLALTYTKNKRD